MTLKNAEKGQMVILDYRQERTDKDYGACLWARFYFDTEDYRLLIDSDCGSGVTSWVPTPRSESFMELMARLSGEEYLLRRLFGDPTEIDTDDVVRNVRELILPEDEETEDYEADESYREMWEREIEMLSDALCGCCSGETVQKVLLEWSYELDSDLRPLSEYDLMECVCYEYTAWQKRVVGLFYGTIQPYISEELNGRTQFEENNDGMERD